MSAHRRDFKYSLSELEHRLITTAAREHNCRPRDMIVKAVAAYAPAAVAAVERDARNELAAIGGSIVPAEGTALTRRERQVIALLAEGLSNKLVGVRLRISDHTAKYFVNQIFKKLGVSSRTAAVTEAIRRGFLSITDVRADSPVVAAVS